MNSRKIDILEMLDRDDAVDYKKDRDEAIRTFVETSQEYYVEQFSQIGARSKFTLTYNWVGLIAITGIFAYQQLLIKDRSREGCFAAFKNNIWVGVVLLGATLIEVL